MGRLILALLLPIMLLSALALPAAPAGGEPLTLTVLESELNPDGGVYEINTGPDGRLWVSDYVAGEIRGYAADGGAVTVYSGLGAVADARSAGEGMVWYVDQDAQRLGRLDSDGATTTTWALPPSFTGTGTALDDEGNVWVSDFSQPLLVRFTPANGAMCTYDTSELASGGSPYVLFDGQALWFSDFYYNALLRLQPDAGRLTRWHLDAAQWDFEAEGLGADGSGGLWFATENTASLGHLDLGDAAAPQLLRYPLPAGGGIPSMLARSEGQVWYNGGALGTLGRLDVAGATPIQFSPQVSETTVSPACTTPAASGPLAVVAVSETPDWTAVAYDVTESGGWTTVTLAEGAMPWGLALAGKELWAADNGRQVVLRAEVLATVRACKLRDGDGDVTTTDDREPQPDWGMTLLRDGSPDAATKWTGDDGCVAWETLPTGVAYGVREESRTGWQALGDTVCDLGTVGEPGSYLCTFVNWQVSSEVYLPLLVLR